MNAEILANESEERTSNVQDLGRTSNVQLSTSNAEPTNGAEVTTKNGERTDSGRTLNIQLSTSNLEPTNGAPVATNEGELPDSEGTSNAEATDSGRTLNIQLSTPNGKVTNGSQVGTDGGEGTNEGRTSNIELSTLNDELNGAESTHTTEEVNIQLATSNGELSSAEERANTRETGRTLNVRPSTSNGEHGNGEANLEPKTDVRGSTSNGQGEFAATVPWSEAVNGAELLDAIAAELRRFVVFGDWIGETFALWILHTHAYRLRQVTTYMGIESPEKECGKSTLLTALSRMVDRPAISANISASAFFHAVAQLQPTLLIDEADTNLRGKDDITGILNSGYTKSTAFVWRMSYDSVNGDQEKGGKTDGPVPGRVARYSCWCPKAIAGIGRLPATLASRCIVVQMHRKTQHEQCERLSRLDGSELKRKCARFVADHQAEIASAEPKIPKGLSNRSADIWEPLLVLADLAGGRWPELARKAALALTGKAEERSPIGALLLDLYLVFTAREAERLFSRDLIAGLMDFGDRPWYELTRGKPLTDATLARQLGKYGIKPRTLRIGKVVSRGYLKSDFSEICQRYIPGSELIALEREAEERTAAEVEEENGTNENSTELGGGI